MGGISCTNLLMEGFVGMTGKALATGRTATWCPSAVKCASKVIGDPCPVRDQMPTCRVLGLRMPPVKEGTWSCAGYLSMWLTMVVHECG